MTCKRGETYLLRISCFEKIKKFRKSSKYFCNRKVQSVFAKTRHLNPGRKGVEATEGVAGATAPGGKRIILYGKNCYV
jgi:hypothetical protein